MGKIYVNLNAYAQALYMFEKAEKFCDDEKIKHDLKKHISAIESKLKQVGA